MCVVHGEDGTWSALDNRCPHQGGPLGDGQLEDGWLICPWHAYQYDTGDRGAAARASATRPPPTPSADDGDDGARDRGARRRADGPA